MICSRTCKNWCGHTMTYQEILEEICENRANPGCGQQIDQGI